MSVSKRFMKVEDQVCSLELSCKLFDLGFDKKSLFVWEYYSDTCYGVKFLPYAAIPDEFNRLKIIHAYTASELIELLPVDVNDVPIHIGKLINGNHYVEYYFAYEKDKNLANSCAKMLITLIEHGFYKND